MKRNVFYFVLSILALLLFSACKKDYYDGTPPRFLINGQESLIDTIKFSHSPFYTFNFEIVDDRRQWELAVLHLQNGLLRYNNRIINDFPLFLDGEESGRLEFEALQPGRFFFILELSDLDDLKSSAQVEIEVIDNLQPMAVLKLTQTGEISPYQVRMDASGSYDPDARWGGALIQYEYSLTGFYTTTGSLPVLQYIYPQPGKYRVGLRVQDNDKVWSPQQIVEIEVK